MTERWVVRWSERCKVGWILQSLFGIWRIKIIGVMRSVGRKREGVDGLDCYCNYGYRSLRESTSVNFTTLTLDSLPQTVLSSSTTWL